MMIKVVLVWSLGILSCYFVSLTVKNQWQMIRNIRPPLLNVRTDYLPPYDEKTTVPEITSNLDKPINVDKGIKQVHSRTRHLQQNQELSIGKYRVDMNEEYLDIPLKFWISGGAVVLCFVILITCYYCKCCIYCCRFCCCPRKRKGTERPKPTSDDCETASEATKSDSGKSPTPNQKAVTENNLNGEEEASFKRIPWWTSQDGKSSINCVY